LKTKKNKDANKKSTRQKNRNRRNVKLAK